MRPVLVVISSMFLGLCCGYLENGKYKNEAQIHCGIDKFCVPAYLCTEEEINVNSEPSLDLRIGFDECGPARHCCHINNRNNTRKYGFDLPYLGSFPPKSFGVGKSIRIEGLVLPKLPKAEFIQLFFVRLQSGQNFWPKPTIAFDLSDSHVIYTADGKSQCNELNQKLDSAKGLNLDIVRGLTSYKAYVNKQLMVEIPMQVDERIMDTLYVNGDFRLMDVKLENFSPTVDQMEQPYLFNDIGVIKEGVSIIVSGYILPNWKRFSVNLRTADNSITLHVNPRQQLSSIVFNVYRNNQWDVPGKAYRMLPSLREGSKFTTQILVTEKCYMIAINGKHVFEFEHRLPYTSVSNIYVDGDIARVDFKRTEVSQYPLGFGESDVEEIWVATD